MIVKTARQPETAALASELEALRRDVAHEGCETYRRWRPRLKRRSFRPSALNLAAYLALRRRDLRALQTALMPLGLSSLGRCESRVIANLDAVRAALAGLGGEASPARLPSAERFFAGERRLRAATIELIGVGASTRTIGIMTTLPSEAATDAALLDRLVAAGMDVARINGAHDDADAWRAMIANVRDAARKRGSRCAICFDLPGPKHRTEEVLLAHGRVRIGDRIVLTTRPDAHPSGATPVVRASLDGVLEHAAAGQPVLIDDGKIRTTIVDVTPYSLTVEVVGAREKGEKLRPEKGLNFPATTIAIPALTPHDRTLVAALANDVDMFGFSFVGTPQDVRALTEAIAAARAPSLPPCGVILKIETAAGVRNLPELIVEAAGSLPTGVMIARGDLAVEIGYERLAEMQEELLWICEAASTPVIWATQVLDGFVKKGIGTRAEFTDAAMAERAECVMLNKGPYVVEAVALLDRLLGRMEGHQTKKTSRMRALRSW